MEIQRGSLYALGFWWVGLRMNIHMQTATSAWQSLLLWTANGIAHGQHHVLVLHVSQVTACNKLVYVTLQARCIDDSYSVIQIIAGCLLEVQPSRCYATYCGILATLQHEVISCSKRNHCSHTAINPKGLKMSSERCNCSRVEPISVESAILQSVTHLLTPVIVTPTPFSWFKVLL